MKFSKLKLSLILLIIKESESIDLLRKLSFYTSSSYTQIIYMLEEIEDRKFIKYEHGNYKLTNDGYGYLAYRGLEKVCVNDFFDSPSMLNIEILTSYIPNR